MKRLTENNIEAVWDELESNQVFQRQAFTKNLRLTLVSM